MLSTRQLYYSIFVLAVVLLCISAGLLIAAGTQGKSTLVLLASIVNIAAVLAIFAMVFIGRKLRRPPS
ncbi:MAG TPA: hypothetical protein VK702_13265 [Candidatus Acidoferrum sp.]|jgi:hypothetical protein|nr:hypothetical protein [Candidatus Acidoferrum sp.]